MTENSGCITVVCKAPVRSLKGFEVVLYNADRNIIDSQRTDKNGIVRLSPPCPGTYTIKVSGNKHLSPKAIYSWITVGRCCNCLKYFVFEARIPPYPIIHAAFKLNDRYYSGLPINKGDIYLWQDHIQYPFPTVPAVKIF